MDPLVSVICLCYNHERFVKEALLSVLNQTYKNIELIIVDDFSNDNSVSAVSDVIKEFSDIKFIKNQKNIGNCKSFNKAFAISKGEFIIDFAADDVMIPERIAEQVKIFKYLDQSYGVIFTNAENIDEEGSRLGLHSSPGDKIPSVDVYKNILEKYFISPPTMMMRRTVLTELGGYDETLAYEDFDFWVRSARLYKYFYLDEVLTQKRKVRHSHSAKFYQKKSELDATTYRVVQKAMWLNKTKEENESLIQRIRYELKHAYFTQNYDLVFKYETLLKDLGGKNFSSRIFSLLGKMKIPLFFFYKKYLKMRSVN